MPKPTNQRKRRLDQLAKLTWEDLNQWTGDRIASRGRSYQDQGHVSDLAVTGDGELIAWVEGTHRYATLVVPVDDGHPTSVCTCPYGIDCKHGVAVLLEYLEAVTKDRAVPDAAESDRRLQVLEVMPEQDSWVDDFDEYDDCGEVEPAADIPVKELKKKTKAQLVDLIVQIASGFPEIVHDIRDRLALDSGDADPVVASVRREIRELCAEPDWQNPWEGEGYPPDFSGVRRKLKSLLDSGRADDVLRLGEELLSAGIQLVEESHDEGESGEVIAACAPLIAEALTRSSLAPAEKLSWAVDVILRDDYALCEAIAEYLMEDHDKQHWGQLADRLLVQLDEMQAPGRLDSSSFQGAHQRDQVSHWTIHALDRAGRKGEVVPLCESEARKTGSYDRLVDRLIAARQYDEAERWIVEGTQATEADLPGIAHALRERLLLVRRRQKDWPGVAAILVDEFLRDPSWEVFKACGKAASKVKAWKQVRERLLEHLETGSMPWEKKGWPLPETCIDRPDTPDPHHVPMVEELIEIAIHEKRPDQVLHWYDQRARRGLPRFEMDDDAIASAVADHAPDRAVEIWKAMAEALIARVKPAAYREAAPYLRKVRKTLGGQDKMNEWDQYLQRLRNAHLRKRRLMETLDGLEQKPILKRP